ncbi:MAG: HlyD family efflux transporter periplasmic adaptor subunit [Gammaproteobacteria bacterium]|nr:HlyD family efflux transporter periplasmic adaptor subunit [Gammaproteobacteria bacterium]MCP5136744.1 HlyD family efflux transporter periplasmic adaptor subunit [Gammaproteobacteria bacterium]
MAKVPEPPTPNGDSQAQTEALRQERLRAVQARVQQRRSGARAPVESPPASQPVAKPHAAPKVAATRAPDEGTVSTQGAQAVAQPAQQPAASGGAPVGLRELLGRVAQVTEAGLRAATTKEAGALLVNRIAEVVATDRVVLIELGLRPRLVNVSGGGVIEQDSRFSEAVALLNRRLRGQSNGVVVPDEPAEGGDAHLRDRQAAMRGTRILWLPLPFDGQASGDQIQYALWLERWRGQNWLPDEVAFLNRAAVFFGQTLRPRAGRMRERLSKRKIVAVILAAFVGAMMIPIESSSIAPARVVPAHPNYVFAPLEGVLMELEVKPGQEVKTGDILFRYDARVIDKKLDESVREVAVARAELERLEGAAFRDAEARSKLPVQRLEVELSESNLEFLRTQRERADVRATADGVVVLDDPDGLIGRPLQLGEQVFSIADPADTKIRMMVPSSDSGLIEEGQRVELRLDRDPLKSIAATVTRVGFDIVMSEEHVPSVMTEAAWAADIPGGVQPGQRGSAKLISKPQPLWKQIFRKPLIKLREITGL